jgi:carbon starvation protein
VTLVPLAWLTAATLTAGWQKVFSADPALGFLAHASSLAGSASPNADRMIFNDRLDAGLALFFMAIVVVILIASAREWFLIATKKKAPAVKEAPYVETGLAVS